MDHSSPPNEKSAFSLRLARLGVILMLSVTTFAVLTMPGCRGCSCNKGDDSASEAEDESDEESAEKKKKEERKKDFEIVQRPNLLPYDQDSTLRPVKPGHWVQSVQEIRTNNFDFYADLQTESLDKDQKPLGLDGSGYHLRSSRPAAFAKGEAKQVRATYFIPKLEQRESKQAWLGFQLLSHKSGREMLPPDPELTSRMPSYQYFFAVLSNNPTRFGFLKKLHSIAPPKSEFSADGSKPHYRVVLPNVTYGPVPLPDNVLAWTSIAYLLWDGVEPERFTPEQQTALVDWLHWGGQIIVDGPNSLDALQASFLSAYLPALKARTVELQQSDFDELNTHWSNAKNLKVRNLARKIDLAGKTVLGIEFDKAADAEFLPNTGQLVVERQIGRGRIVVSAFSLALRPFANWTFRDGFFNACLLRLPSRLFEVSDAFSPADVSLPGYQNSSNPLLTTTLRFFTRDIGPAAEPRQPVANASVMVQEIHETQPGKKPTGESEASDTWHFGGYDADPTSGVGGWNDFNGAAEAARSSLKDAAGISTPSAQFVLSVLAMYLVVLVPINWGFFRLIGRVEWAWIAAPLIAIVGAVVVVRSAQLDIGFVRSRTEIAVLELHGGYSRGHLTRFTALYSSLSTTYEATLDDPGAQAIPFAGRLSRDKVEALDVIDVRQEKLKTLDGYKVRSNSTGILRSEHMYPAKGSLQLVGDNRSGWRVANDTGLALRDVGVLRRDLDGKAEVAWVGELAGDETAALRFSAPKDGRAQLEQWNDSSTAFSIEEQVLVLLREYDANNDGRLDRSELKDRPDLLEHFERSDAASSLGASGLGAGKGFLDKDELARCCRFAREGELRLGRFFDLATKQLQLGRGEVRLIGWTDQELEGVAIRPAASQASFRTFVLVHLRGPMPLPAKPDQNHFLDVASDDFDEE